MNVLSLFDGMSCGQLALKKAGIIVNNYFASEIDKYAIKVTQANFPKTIQLGDINDWENWDLPKIDILFAGFPCQAWSIAGKQKGLSDPRGKLAVVLSDIFEHLKKLNPKMIFLFENVRMKKENLDYMDNLFGVKHIMINSALVSAQNRVRCYWTNIPNITQPDDKKIFLKDIVENGIVDRDKSHCVDASYYKGGNLPQYFKKARRQLVFQINPDKSAGGKQPQNQIGCLTSCSWQHNNFLTSIVSENKIYYRKLTPVECERLQTVPDGYTNYVSNTQRYKMLGNGWTVDIISWILSFMHGE